MSIQAVHNHAHAAVSNIPNSGTNKAAKIKLPPPKKEQDEAVSVSISSAAREKSKTSRLHASGAIQNGNVQTK